MTINYDAKGQAQVNLSDLLLSAAPGAAGSAVITVARGGKPQKTALLEEFSDVFAVTMPVAEETPAADLLAARELPDGKDVPVGTGNILPELAALALPVAPEAAPQPTQSEVAVAITVPAPVSEASTALVQTVSGDDEPATTCAQQRFDRHDGVLRASERQVLFMQPPPSRPQVEPPATAAPPSPAPAPAQPLRALQIELPLHVGSTPAATLPDDTPLAKGEQPQAIAADQATRPFAVAQLLRTPARAAPATQPLADTSETTPETQPQRAVPTPAVNASTAPQQPATPTLVAAEALRPATTHSTAEPAQSPAPTQLRHDFGQVVERLAEAREMARPGRAEMQVMHREFGQVSMQFDVTGSALKVALANAHAGFAPAVQAALAERTDMAGQQQGHASSQTTASQQATSTAQTTLGQSTLGQSTLGQSTLGQSAQGDAQHQRQHDAPRAATVQSQPREHAEAPESETASRTNPRRDNALFA